MDARFSTLGSLTGAILSALLLTGCGGEYAPTTGIINVDGAPAAGATVIFNPASGNQGRATGRTDESGRYSLMTATPGDGARPGDYVVTVVWLQELKPAPGETTNDPENMAPTEDRLKGRYASQTADSPKVTVPPGGGELPPIELKSK